MHEVSGVGSAVALLAHLAERRRTRLASGTGTYCCQVPPAPLTSPSDLLAGRWPAFKFSVQPRQEPCIAAWSLDSCTGMTSCHVVSAACRVGNASNPCQLRKRRAVWGAPPLGVLPGQGTATTRVPSANLLARAPLRTTRPTPCWPHKPEAKLLWCP